MAEFFFELGLIILTATILGIIVRFLKQPLILAYVLTGILLGPIGFGLVSGSKELEVFAQIGIALLLFIVGISLSTKHFKQISLIVGIGQVIFTFIVGYLIAFLEGFTLLEAVYISIALTFSSTIIIVKLLSDKGQLESLHGRIALGILLVQDFIAVLCLILISGFREEVSLVSLISTSLIKGILLFIILYLAYKLIIKHLFKHIAKNNELLLFASIAWCIGIATFAIKFGFSLEMGAFLAGLFLANSEFSLEISAKIRTLRDFFIAIFFINLGLVMVFDSVKEFIIPIVIFSLFILIGNPLIVFFIMILLGYRSRTSLLAGLTVAQISEFSLILMALGLSLGHVSKDAVVLVTTVGIITITISTYLINYSESIFNLFSKYLHKFERKNLKEKVLRNKNIKYDILLFGCHRMGFNIINKLKHHKILVVDFDPEIINKLNKKGINSIYADINDNEIIEELASLKPKFVISTIPEIHNNKIIIKAFKKVNDKVVIFTTCKNTMDCLELYKFGSDFVTYPEILAGQKVADYLTHLDSKKIKKWGSYYRQKLLEDLKHGHTVF